LALKYDEPAGNGGMGKVVEVETENRLLLVPLSFTEQVDPVFVSAEIEPTLIVHALSE
jgi:hypothetical protein